jgi:nicotinate-nucleotide adenylyltransferase
VSEPEATRAICDIVGVSPSRKIAILGGSFDPPHAAHIEIARMALERLGVDKVLLVVAGDPYQKHAEASAQARYEMACIAAKGIDGVEVSRIEVDRPGPSYTIDTVEALLAEDPSLEIWLVLGSDAMEGIRTWHRWKELVEKVKFCVVPRRGHPVDEDLSATLGQNADVVIMELPRPLDYSSTEIRKALASGKTPDGIDPAVARYIEEHELYHSGSAVAS